MEQTPQGIGIIGYGGMGSWHADLIQRIPQLALVGVYDIDEKRQAAAKEKNIHSYSSLEELLADPAILLVTIATPNDTHLPLVLQALNAGKHVVCEKPVAMNAGEVRQMAEKAAEKNLIFTVHQNRRWDEDYKVIQHLYQNGTLGPVFNIESRVHGSRGIPGDWRNQKQHGGGMVLDWGVHIIDQVVRMLAPLKLQSLYANLTYVTNTAVDDGFKLMLNFENNIGCFLEVGTSNFINLPRWYIQGENGSAIVQDWDRNGEIVMVSDWQNRDAQPVVTAAGLTKTMAPRTEETIQSYPLPSVTSDIRDYYKNVLAAIHGSEPLIVKPEEVIEVMDIIDAIFVSASENKVITFPL